MSGGEPSSIKRSSRCAARAPVLSSRLENRVGADFDLGVYGLVLQFDAVLLFPVDRIAKATFGIFLFDRGWNGNASGFLQKMETANL